MISAYHFVEVNISAKFETNPYRSKGYMELAWWRQLADLPT
jgi:hypothetical protein